jgi:DNA-binding protein Fis
MNDPKLIHIDIDTGQPIKGGRLEKLLNKIEKDIIEFFEETEGKCTRLEYHLIIHEVQQRLWDYVINHLLGLYI